MPGSRGERVQQVKEAVEAVEGREISVEEMAARLNAVATAFGFEPRWSGPRFSKMVHGQEPALEDAAAIVGVDPQKRGWEWFVFGNVAARQTRTRNTRYLTTRPEASEQTGTHGKRSGGSA